MLANLANFAYDPINFTHLRTVGAIDLFIEQLASDDKKLKAFAAAGLCNLSNGNICQVYSIFCLRLLYELTVVELVNVIIYE